MSALQGLALMLRGFPNIGNTVVGEIEVRCNGVGDKNQKPQKYKHRSMFFVFCFVCVFVRGG